MIQTSSLSIRNESMPARYLAWDVTKQGTKGLMVKAKPTAEDVCLAILSNHTMASWKLKLTCQGIIPLLRGPMLTGQLQTQWKAHQVKHETWAKQRIQEPAPLHSGHWLNTITKKNHKRQRHTQWWLMYTSRWWATGQQRKRKQRQIQSSDSKHNPVWVTTITTQKKPQPSAGVSQENHERWNVQIPNRMWAAARR